MFPWQKLLLYIIGGTVQVFSEPLFWGILAVVAFQYWQMQRQQIKMFGVYGYSLRQQVMLAAVYGIVGGVLGSMLLTVVGVTLNKLGIAYIWPVAILLMMINMRFMCFAYAGGLVALANVLFGWPEVNVPQVLALVAVLHITESVLIFISGRYSAVPLILRREDGQLVGAFNLQNFWPLPLVLLVAAVMPTQSLPGEMLNMPDWWPLLPPVEQAPEGSTLVHGMWPVVAALGYADIAIASTPVRRRRQSAFHLALYSILLLVLAVLSAKYPWLQVFAALLSPLGHEFLIQLDNRRETEGEPLFVPPERGVMVLDTVAGSAARKAGLRPADIILGLDGLTVDNGFELARAISYAAEEFTINISRAGQQLQKRGKFVGGERRLGVIPVPSGYEQYYAEMAPRRYGLADWLKQRWGRRNRH